MWQIDFLQPPAPREGSFGYFGDAFGQDNGGEFLACPEGIRGYCRCLLWQAELAFLAWRADEQCLGVFGI